MDDIVCIVCPNSCSLKLKQQGSEVLVEGAKCSRGIDFAKEELICPKRTLCTTVATSFKVMPMLPVKTNGEIPKELMAQAMEKLRMVNISCAVSRGDVIIKDILNTGVDVISTSDMHIF